MAGMPLPLDYEPRCASLVQLLPLWLRRALLVAGLVVGGYLVLVTTIRLLFSWIGWSRRSRSDGV